MPNSHRHLPHLHLRTAAAGRTNRAGAVAPPKDRSRSADLSVSLVSRLRSYGLYSYGLDSYGLYSYGLYSYGRPVSASRITHPNE